MLGGGGVKHGLRGSPALCSGRGGRSLQRLLTGIGICERALWESLAVRDQLWRDVPTTPTGVAKVGARGGHVAKRARAAHAAIDHARAASDENRIFIDSRRPISVVRFSDQRQHAYASNLATATGDTLMILLTSAREQPRLYKYF
jgi:hypothetical protein